MTSFKIFFPDNTIRRFRCDTFPDFEEFVRLMSNLYTAAFHPEMKLQYVDSDGDKCTITTELEWKEMKQELGNQLVYRLYVAEGDAKNYFKDGPAPELIKVYTNALSQEPVALEEAGVISGVQERVTKALENLFANRKILPHNIPSYLEGVITLKTRDDKSVDLDVNVAGLASALHQRAYNLLDNSASVAALTEAKSCLISQLTVDPESSVGYYNLACAESLLNNLTDALTALKKSVELGFHDVNHITTDPDLKNLHNDPGFTAITSLAKSCLAKSDVKAPEPEPEVEVKQPEPEPEPQSESETPKKWHNELQALAEMGFLDQSILVQTLDKTNGNIEQALTDLLG